MQSFSLHDSHGDTVTQSVLKQAFGFSFLLNKELTIAYLQITLNISEQNRAAAAAVYQKYKTPFLSTIDGAVSKELLVRQEDVQVLHGFKTAQQAEAYLDSRLFITDVVEALKPYLNSAPDVRIYTVA